MELLSATQLLKFFAALAFVLGLMGGLGVIMRRINARAGGLALTGNKRRLRIVEILPVDHRRKLILLRRDGKEHLVILGPTGETVIESGIEPESNNENP